MYLRTEAKHFSIGTLATPIRIAGPFKDLSFTPSPELAVRGVVAVGWDPVPAGSAAAVDPVRRG